ncbi:DUF6233 domain-containing protein [[Kitasatospora] papulosa]
MCVGDELADHELDAAHRAVGHRYPVDGLQLAHEIPGSVPGVENHRGGCATYPDQVGLISCQDAMVALAEPAIKPCAVCRPQTVLLY